MPSRVDPNHPATGVAVSKAVSRANWAAAKAEIEHGGFFEQAGIGALERPVADRLAETISARDFGALGDDSGVTIAEWLTGGQYSRGAADLTELRTMTGIADLELTDTIDWAAITAAKNFALERPVYLPAAKTYRIARALVFAQGGLLGEMSSSGSPMHNSIIRKKAGSPASDVIRLEQSGNNRHFFFKNLTIVGGTRGLYGIPVGGERHIDQQSVFENIYFGGAVEEGFFFDGLQAIGCHFDHIIAENCGSHGIRFTGFINGSQISDGRAVDCGGHGFMFENRHAEAAVPGLMLSSLVAEYNQGAGIALIGVQAALYSPYFEFNDFDATGEPDLLLASTNTSPSKVHARVTCVQPYFAGIKQPSGVNVSGSAGGTQSLTILDAHQASSSAKINTNFLELVVVGRADNFIVQGTNRPVLIGSRGTDLIGATTITTSGNLLGVRAAPTIPGGVLQVLASHSDGNVASYLLRRNDDGTVTALHTAGEDFLTFGVDGDGRITATTTGGTATVSVHGH